MTESATVEDIKVSPGISVYLLSGTDEYRVGAAARRVVDGLCPPAEQVFGVEEIAGQADNADQAATLLRRCIVAIQTLGFISNGKVVWLRDATFFRNQVLMRSAAVQQWMGELTDVIKRGLPAGHRLVISCPGVDGRSAFYKACDAAGMVVGFDIPEKAWLADKHAEMRTVEAFRAAGLRADGAAMVEFVRRVGPDTRTIHQETAKLACYLGDRKDVKAADVADVVSTYRESEVWDLADRVGERDLSGALAVFRRLLRQKEEPVRLVTGLETRFRELAFVRDAAERGWLRMAGREAVWSSACAPAMDALGEWDLRKMHAFRVGRLLEQAGRYELRELLRAGRETTKVREQVVGGFGSADLLVELLLLKLLAPVRRRAGPPVGA